MAGATFRERLIHDISRTVYARNEYTQKGQEEVCAMLGVRPDVLEEARLRCLEQPIRPKNNKKRVEGAHPRFEDTINYQVQQLLKVEIARRQSNMAALTRAIMNHYLMNQWDPEKFCHTWVDLYPQSRGEKTLKKLPWGRVPIAACVVFAYRAKQLRVSQGSLGRTLIVEMLRGNYARHNEIKYVTIQQMGARIEDYPGVTSEDIYGLKQELAHAEETWGDR